MNKLINKLPLLAFVLAAFAAVAFTSPETGEYAQDPDNPSIWYDLSEVDPGPETYECNNTGNCLRDAPSTSGTVIANGMFVKHSDELPVVP
jgi:hypothetical protein